MAKVQSSLKKSEARFACEFCGSNLVEVRSRQIEKHPVLGVVSWRKYRCSECGKAYRTLEVYATLVEAPT